MNGCCMSHPAPRLLVIPGLHGSGPDHWQTWLERRHRSSRRVEQADWAQANLDAWAARIADTLAAEPAGPWFAVAHSFGALAVLQHLCTAHAHAQPSRQTPTGTGVVAALLVAPADPVRHAVHTRLLQRSPLREITLVTSSNDPWLPTHAALGWAHRWGARLVDIGDAGHINPASGFSRWPYALQWVDKQAQQCRAERRAETAEMAEAATLREPLMAH